MTAPVTYYAAIAKLDEDKRLVFGWAYQAKKPDGTTVEDHSRKVIPMEELEPAVYQFMIDSRTADEMHERVETEDGERIGDVVESMLFSKDKLRALGLAEDALPEGWWVGVRVYPDEVWAKVKDGTYRMFSVTGLAHETPIEA